MTDGGLQDRPCSEDSTVHDTALLLPGREPDVSVAFVPAPDVVTQGGTVAAALVAARAAAIGAVRGTIEEGEEPSAAPPGAIVETIDVPVPLPASGQRASRPEAAPA